MKRIMVKKMSLVSMALLLMLTLGGCFEIKKDVDYPQDLFDQTLAKIEQIQRLDPQRTGPVSRLNILIYVGEDRQMISLTVPSSTLESILNLVQNTDQAGEIKNEIKKEMDKYGNVLEDIDLQKIKDLPRLGPGLLLEIQVEEKGEFVHVLIWMD